MKNLNTDDIFVRNLSISLIELLNRSFIIEQKVEGITHEKTIPFFFNFATDEQFMKDWFIGIPETCVLPKAEGNYDQRPRGIITWKGMSVSTQDVTNKFIRGNYSVHSTGPSGQNQMDAYSAFLFAIPFNVTYDIEILCSTLNQSFKVMQSLLEFYANDVMFFRFKGLRIPGQFKFPEEQALEKTRPFDYSIDQTGKITFQITVETYFPSFNKDSIRKSKNVIEKVGYNFKPLNGNDFTYISGWQDQGTIDANIPTDNIVVPPAAGTSPDSQISL